MQIILGNQFEINLLDRVERYARGHPRGKKGMTLEEIRERKTEERINKDAKGSPKREINGQIYSQVGNKLLLVL